MARKKIKRYEIIILTCHDTNCQSDVRARPEGTHKKWKRGPRCKYCKGILGCIEWRVHLDWNGSPQIYEATSEEEALDAYSRERGFYDRGPFF